MNVLVVNIGSTSLKFRLFDMATETVRARGGVEGVGTAEARVSWQIGDGEKIEQTRRVADQAEAVRLCLTAIETEAATIAPRFQISNLKSQTSNLYDAVGFKAVHGGPIGGPARVDDEVLALMAAYADLCPAHNPAYIAAMKAFAAQRPQTPLVAAFETGFHQTIPPARQTYAIPHAWTTEYGVRRYGFHGASHAYVAGRTAELLGREDLRVISCHLGGSSSVCALAAGRSVACSFGMSPQSGLPHNNRVGDFDPYALPLLARRTGRSIVELLATMSKEGGLLGISGVSNDMRAVLAAAQAGDTQAALARDVFVESVRHYLGAYVVALGGLDALVFTGGIGERSPEIRTGVCAGLEFLGIRLDPAGNAAPAGDGTVSAEGAKVRILALETNEELVVARQTQAVLQSGGSAAGR